MKKPRLFWKVSRREFKKTDFLIKINMVLMPVNCLLRLRGDGSFVPLLWFLAATCYWVPFWFRVHDQYLEEIDLLEEEQREYLYSNPVDVTLSDDIDPVLAVAVRELPGYEPYRAMLGQLSSYDKTQDRAELG